MITIDNETNKFRTTVRMPAATDIRIAMKALPTKPSRAAITSHGVMLAWHTSHYDECELMDGCQQPTEAELINLARQLQTSIDVFQSETTIGPGCDKDYLALDVMATIGSNGDWVSVSSMIDYDDVTAHWLSNQDDICADADAEEIEAYLADVAQEINDNAISIVEELSGIDDEDHDAVVSFLRSTPRVAAAWNVA